MVGNDTVLADSAEEKNEHAERMQDLVEEGLSTAEAVDYYIVVEEGMVDSGSEWADAREVTPQSVNQNIRQAKEKLSQIHHRQSGGE